MDAEVKRLWVADLRANPESQGTGMLDYIDDDGKRKQCCLGRLCLLAVAAGVIPAPELHNDIYRYLDYVWENDNATSLVPAGEEFIQTSGLPGKVAEWAKVLVDEDRFNYGTDITLDDDEESSLTCIEANDGVGMSYVEIADLVERNVPVTV